MSDFAIKAEQRRQLLEGNYAPMDFATKPYGCEPGAVYVIEWQRARKLIVKGQRDEDTVVLDIPRRPVRTLTVTAVQRHRKGFWRVRFDVLDRRDPERYLRAVSGYTSSKWLAVDELDVPEWTPQMVQRAKTVDEFWHAERLKRHAEDLRQEAAARSRARRNRAA